MINAEVIGLAADDDVDDDDVDDSVAAEVTSVAVDFPPSIAAEDAEDAAEKRAFKAAASETEFDNGCR